MCSLTWCGKPDGYEVFFNRDEQKTRPKAVRPMVSETNGVLWLAPKDPEAGGTWIWANQFGLTASLLNLYEREQPAGSVGEFRSRGLLLADLASSRCLEQIQERLTMQCPNTYNAFTLLAFQRAGNSLRVWSWRWDLRSDTFVGPDTSPKMPVCSSSFRPEEVLAGRNKLFARITGGSPPRPETLARFHRYDNGGNPSAWTVRMRRDDAETLSISRISVTGETIRFDYEDPSLTSKQIKALPLA